MSFFCELFGRLTKVSRKPLAARDVVVFCIEMTNTRISTPLIRCISNRVIIILFSKCDLLDIEGLLSYRKIIKIKSNAQNNNYCEPRV